MNKNDLQIYENIMFGDIRTVIIDNEPWFVGVDIAEALGYAQPRDAIKKIVPDKDKCYKMLDLRMRYAYAGSKNIEIPTITRNDKSSGKKRTTLINESGLYKLVFRSTLPEAEMFTDWVTSEVLPSIRKTGAYVAEWNKVRELGKLSRLKLTDAIKLSGENERLHGHAYSLYTNLVYKIVFQKTTQQLKRERRLSRDAELRDYLTDEELNRVEAVERVITSLLVLGYTYQDIKDKLLTVNRGLLGLQ